VSKDDTTYTLTSTGTVDSVVIRKIEQSVVADEIPQAFTYAIFAEDDIDFDSSTGTITGDVETRDEVKKESGMTIIDGEFIEDSSKTCPSVNYNSYESIADSTHNSDYTFTSAGSPYSGIHYCEKKATIEGNVTINGSIISEEEVLFEGDDITITRSSNYPAVIAKKGIDIVERDNIDITGLIFVDTSGEVKIEKSTNVTIEGAIVCEKAITIKECPSITITFDSDIQSNPPPYFSGGTTIAAVTPGAWEETN